MQFRARWMIRAMNLRMAVQAGTSQQKAVVEVVVCFLAGIRPTGMAGRRVALLAQRGRPLDQHSLVVAAVRPVADCTILGGWRVLPQERPTFFCMAQIAGQVDGGALQQEIVIAIVWIMATAAGHAAETQRMATGLERVGSFSGMTAETGFLLRECIKNAVAFRVNLVAGCTGQIFTLMGAAKPGQSGTGFVTAQADLVLFSNRGRGFGAEGDWWIVILPPALGARVLFSGAMAGFAL